jgi:hypothetical protein
MKRLALFPGLLTLAGCDRLTGAQIRKSPTPKRSALPAGAKDKAKY